MASFKQWRDELEDEKKKKKTEESQQVTQQTNQEQSAPSFNKWRYELENNIPETKPKYNQTESTYKGPTPNEPMENLKDAWGKVTSWAKGLFSGQTNQDINTDKTEDIPTVDIDQVEQRRKEILFAEQQVKHIDDRINQIQTEYILNNANVQNPVRPYSSRNFWGYESLTTELSKEEKGKEFLRTIEKNTVDKKNKELLAEKELLNSASIAYKQYAGQLELNTGVEGAIKDAADLENFAKTKVPFLSDIFQYLDLWQLKQVSDKYEAGGYDNLSQFEKALLEDYRAKTLLNQIDRGVPYKAANVVLDMPKYMLEFIATGGMYSTTATATKKVASKVVANEIAQNLLGSLVGTAARTTAFTPRIGSQMIEYTLPSYDLVAGKDGTLTMEKIAEGDDYGKAFLKALGSVYTETLIENLGGGIESKEFQAGIKSMLSKLERFTPEPAKVLAKALVGKVAKINNITTQGQLRDMMAKYGGFNGLFSEVLEEEVSELLQAPIEERKYYSLVTPEGQERFLVETLGIAAFSGLAKVPDIIMDTPQSKEDVIEIPDNVKIIPEDAEKINQEVIKNLPEEIPVEEPVEEPIEKPVETPEKKDNIITNVNPTNGLFVKYDPESRMKAELGENITTLDKTMNKSPNETIIIYRGMPSDYNKINPGDFITTNEQLAKDYAGNGNVISKEVKLSDLLDDKTEPLGEEYIYRPKEELSVEAPIKEEINEKKADINNIVYESPNKSERASLIIQKEPNKDSYTVYIDGKETLYTYSNLDTAIKHGEGMLEDRKKLVEFSKKTLLNGMVQGDFKPAEFNETFGENPVMFKTGDYIVDTEGNLKVVVSGNEKYFGDEVNDYLKSINISTLRTSLIGDTSNEKDGYLDYANQVRLATPEEIATIRPEYRVKEQDKPKEVEKEPVRYPTITDTDKSLIMERLKLRYTPDRLSGFFHRMEFGLKPKAIQDADIVKFMAANKELAAMFPKQIEAWKEITGVKESKPKAIGGKSIDLFNALKEQVGDIIDMVEPVGSLWQSKGDVIFISQKRERGGFIEALRSNPLVLDAQEGGNNVIKVTIKTSALPIKKGEPVEEPIDEVEDVNVSKAEEANKYLNEALLEEDKKEYMLTNLPDNLVNSIPLLHTMKNGTWEQVRKLKTYFIWLEMNGYITPENYRKAEKKIDARLKEMQEVEAEKAKQMRDEIAAERAELEPDKPSKPKTDKQKLADLIAGHKTVKVKRSSIPILEDIIVRNGQATTLNLDKGLFLSKPTELADGAYRVVGKEVVLTSQSLDDLPSFIDGEKKAVAKVNKDVLTKVVEDTALASGADEPRPVLTSMFMNFDPASNVIDLIATDGYRLHKYILPAQLESKNAKGSILVGGPKILAKVLSQLDNSPVEINIIETKDGSNYIEFKNDSGSIKIRAVDGAFPEVEEVYKNASFDFNYKLDKKEFTNAIKEIEPIAKQIIGFKITIELDNKAGEFVVKAFKPDDDVNLKKEIRVKAIPTDQGPATTFTAFTGNLIMPMRTEGEVDPNIVGLNYKFLLDALRTTEANNIVFSYQEPMKPIVIMNDETKTVINKERPSGSVGASSAGYVSMEDIKLEIDELEAIPLPEMLSIYKDITDGMTPQITNRLRKYLGYAVPSSLQIKLSTKAFLDENLAAQVFAHELGHIIDYIPDRTSKRGNLIGRIRAIRSFMQSTFGNLDNKVFRTELKALTQKWNPFNEDAVKPSYKQYRYSSTELYGDYISMLFNVPTLARNIAPNFTEAFFNNLDKKPALRDSLFIIQETLHGGEGKIYEKRKKDLYKMFARGEEIWAKLEYERTQKKKDVGFLLKQAFSNQDQAFLDRVKAVKKSGVKLADELNPEYILEEMKYSEGPLHNFAQERLQPLLTALNENGIDMKYIDSVLTLERIMADRKDKANPLGYSPTSAKKQLAGIQNELGEEKWNALQGIVTDFRQVVADVVDIAEKEGFYTSELINLMKENTAYASFQVLDHLSTNVSSQIFKTVGTFKEVASPFTTTSMKMISTLSAIDRNKAKKKLIKFLVTNFDDVKPSATKWNGVTRVVKETKDPGMTTVKVIEEGVVKGYDMEEYLGYTFGTIDNTTLKTATYLVKKISLAPLLRPIYTSINLGYQTFNFVRDISRSWKAMPDKTLGEILTSFPRLLKSYFKAIPSAWNKAINKADPVIREMYERKILGITYNEIHNTFNEEDTEMERVLARLDIKIGKGRTGIAKIFSEGIAKLETIGTFVEALPKVAAFERERSNVDIGQLELGSMIRNQVGSPDFRKGGTLTPITNNLFLFSNAAIQGWKTDINNAFVNPRTRSGFWVKTSMLLLPTFINLMIQLGLFGDDNEELLKGVSEYDKTNYSIIILGQDENGKTVYLRLPRDETTRFIGGIFWKLLDGVSQNDFDLSGLSQVIDYTSGQIPSISPVLTGAGHWLTYLSGRNPYDDFRGRYIIPDTEFKAGTSSSFLTMINWTLQNSGANIIAPGKTYGEPESDLEKVINLPVVNNILGRWIKSSDYGKTEIENKMRQEEEKATAIETLAKREAITKYVTEYLEKGGDSKSYINKIAKEILGDMPSDGYHGGDLTKYNNIVKAFNTEVATREGDKEKALLGKAVTNTTKKRILDDAKQNLSSETFQKLIYEAWQEKLISEPIYNEYK